MYTVAYLDDDSLSLLAVSSFLSNKYTVKCALRPTQLYKSISDFSVKALIIDICLGIESHADGIAVAHFFRQNGFNLPIIFLSSSDDDSTKNRTKSVPNSYFVSKATLVDNLEPTLNKAIRLYVESLPSV